MSIKQRKEKIEPQHRRFSRFFKFFHFFLFPLRLELLFMCTLTDQSLLLTVELKWGKDYTQRWCRLVVKYQEKVLLGKMEESLETRLLSLLFYFPTALFDTFELLLLLLLLVVVVLFLFCFVFCFLFFN